MQLSRRVLECLVETHRKDSLEFVALSLPRCSSEVAAGVRELLIERRARDVEALVESVRRDCERAIRYRGNEFWRRAVSLEEVGARMFSEEGRV